MGLFTPKWKHADRDVRMTAVKALTDQRKLAEVLGTDPEAMVREAAVRNVTDQSVLAQVALTDDREDMRAAAVGHITAEDALRNLLETHANRWGDYKAIARRMHELSFVAMTGEEAYGMCPSTPVRCGGATAGGGPKRSREYLGSLRCPAGRPADYTRTSTVDGSDPAHPERRIDVYDVRCRCGCTCTVYVGMYTEGEHGPIGVHGWSVFGRDAFLARTAGIEREIEAGHYDTAQRMCREAGAGAPRDAQAVLDYLTGHAYACEGSITYAVKWFGFALDNPDATTSLRAQTLFAKGAAYLHEGSRTLAGAAFAEAVLLDPAFADDVGRIMGGRL